MLADVHPMPVTRPMRVLMLSWEYPPVVVGGLGRHVHALATSLAAAGHQVTVVTRHAPGAPLTEYAEGVRIVRAPEDPPSFPLATPSLLAWTMAFNHTLTRAALRAVNAPDSGGFDVIHAHDWLVTHTAVTLKEHLGVPLVATIHATEAGRHQGWLPGEMNKCIHTVEWWLAHEASRVLVCSGYMKWEVSRLLELRSSKVTVIPNGVNRQVWRAPAPRAIAAARQRFGGDGPLIGFAGRLVYEKGVQHLVEAVPQLRDRHPDLRVVIAGDGPYAEALRDQTSDLRLHGTVSFPGFLTEHELPAMYAATDATVVPSLYEPFGMVALEAAAAGAPLAVSDTGGLAEIVEPGVTGVKFASRDTGALAEAVGTLLADEVFARRVATSARAMIAQRYGWRTIAARTATAYRRAVTRTPATVRVPSQLRTPVVPEGNLLERVAA